MAQSELFDLAATRKILGIGDAVDDPELEEQGAIWSDQVESDCAEFVDSFPLTGEALTKGQKACSLGTASGFKNNRNNKDQADYYLKLYNNAIEGLKTYLRSKPKSARVSVRNEYKTKLLFSQQKRL